MRGIFGLMLLGLVLSGAGCTRTFRSSATQPNPLKDPTETLRHSEKITIVTGDMELDAPAQVEQGYTSETQRASIVRPRRYPLFNQASFTIVSRDRLRFHVQVDHKWEEWADLKTWSVDLVDDTGRHWIPESVEHARTKLMTTMWDREQRTAVCSSSGRNAAGNCYNTIGFADDGWRRRQTLGSLSVFRGSADFVFYQRDLFHANVRKLRLVVKRPGEVFEFTWNFRDAVAGE
ncbi:MAG: hypothetical protein KF773_22045 [Deltaproteobacteria bacterium]|nr:hypothetical protein [Deltaproteobacteria bacterium]MCW5804141.1 hypothetical protein [Deltaproteobacteria bacterium]